MATLKDIGAELGLSPATVSRALNGFPEVNSETRERVREAADRLGYRPNRVAQRLVTGRSGMVGMILRMRPDMREDPTLFDMLTGLSAALSLRDVDLVLAVDQETDPVAAYERMLSRSLVDGFILAAPEPDDPRIAYLQAHDLPFVVHGRHAFQADYPFYDIDNRKLARDSVALLTSLGHRRIGFVNGEAELTYAQDRLREFRVAMAAAGAPVEDSLISHGRLTESHGYASALAMLSRPEGLRPTAILCSGTMLAKGVYRAAHDLAIAIPQALSVVAHDDIWPGLEADRFDPPLTTTAKSMRAACDPLADLLIQRIAGAAPAGLRHIEEADFFLRESTGPAPPREGDARR
ncbi:LacI family DNA-binding transcriptional regulator [Roseisalinus antarcticus]|uniref:HTH-type transcriptional regulator RafR n=1 Tax=Roseisalinus antarcticus TaxID=254357 RepID=A0A1Y5S9G7_9RHOB|nr:substrate-binding domain-containing protein [Roseisalinus antarcticus]SLN35526.1 HTH-type transcriptional regulator RafR [Roseisalinus antarcticus]